MDRKVAFISGITGQDGSYLAELLLHKGYEVHGLVRRSSTFNRGRIEALYLDKVEIWNRQLFLHYGDITDTNSIVSLIQKIQPTEIYNLAAQSHVKVSFETPGYTSQVNGIGALNLLECMRSMKNAPRLYQASTSELYGRALEVPQTETTPFCPQSPYAVAKQFAFWMTKNYRETYGLYSCNGILFNHESPRRAENFVTKKITSGVARLKMGDAKILELGNLNSRRDWGYAPDYVEGMWRMLQQDIPDDYVLATGRTSSIKEFVELAFRVVEIEIEWAGSGLEERGYDSSSGSMLVKVSLEYYRPAEVDFLVGDATKARTILGWTSKVQLDELVNIMVRADLERMDV